MVQVLPDFTSKCHIYQLSSVLVVLISTGQKVGERCVDVIGARDRFTHDSALARGQHICCFEAKALLRVASLAVRGTWVHSAFSLHKQVAALLCGREHITEQAGAFVHEAQLFAVLGLEKQSHVLAAITKLVQWGPEFAFKLRKHP